MTSGRETGLEYLTLEAPGVWLLPQGKDIRLVVYATVEKKDTENITEGR